MKIYILNHHVGGVPFDGHTIGVYKTLEQAQEELKRSIKTFGYDEFENDEDKGEINITDTSWYVDDWDTDFFGGCAIQEMEINN